MTDHERIWLEPAPGADEEYGRMWCQDNVWGDDATEYVRAAAFEALEDESEELRIRLAGAFLNVGKAEARIADLEGKLAEATDTLKFYANPEIYKPHPHGPAFDRRDLSFSATSTLSTLRSQP